MRLDCECGFVARGAAGEELVAAAQAHARDAHLVDLTAEVILALAGATTGRPVARSRVEGAE